MHLAVQNEPMNKFKPTLELLRKNHVKTLQGKDSNHACSVFLDSLEYAMVQYLKEILSRIRHYGILFDGSSNKAGTNKELVFVKVLVS